MRHILMPTTTGSPWRSTLIESRVDSLVASERWRKRLQSAGFRTLDPSEVLASPLLRHAPGSSANLVPALGCSVCRDPGCGGCPGEA